MSKFIIEFYEKKDGTQPVKIFIDKLDLVSRAGVLSKLDILEENGNDLREPYSKHLEDGIFELRIKGENSLRILYFFQVGKKIILTNGFKKKSQKTPRIEIIRAKKYRDDYIKRKGQ